jgi:hypothetical protein
MLDTRENLTVVDLRDHVIIMYKHAISYRSCCLKCINELNIILIVLIDRYKACLLRTDTRLAFDR